MTNADSSDPGAPSQAKPATLLHHGEHDADVLKLQQQLHRLGYPIAADGVFGPQTEAALRDAQAHAGVDPNGIAGPQSTLALANLEAQGFHADPHAPEHPHHHGHHEAVVDLGTLPVPEAPHDPYGHEDPYKPEEQHDLHGHEDPYKPEDDHASALHPEFGHADPYASHHEPDHGEPKDDESY